MAEDRKSLNLIQRALDRKSGHESGPASVDHIAAAPLRAAPLIGDGGAPADHLAPMRGALANDSQAPAEPEAVQYTRLNMAVLRRSGMINPEVKTSTIANEFRNVKRKVLLAARDKKSRELVNNLVMVTSTLPEEGKTFTSVNLSLSLAAERDVQVLLIDCDLHRPSVGKFFENSKQQPGMADLLTNPNAQVADVVRRCESVPNLSLIFAGKRVDDSPELIASTRMRDILVDMSERYRDRVIIIDTPPALTTFEPAILAPHVHQAIMVVSAQHSGRHQIEKALDSISSCANISFLFNKAPKWEQKDGGYYYNYEPKPAAGT